MTARKIKPTEADQPPIGGFCDECGHYAARHDEAGCHGVDPKKGCLFGKGATKRNPKPCSVMMWDGVAWPRPWDLKAGYDKDSWERRLAEKQAEAAERAKTSND